MNTKIIVKIYRSPFGEMFVGSYKDKLCLCDWKYRKMRKQIDIRLQNKLHTTYEFGDSITIQQTIQQLDEYFKGIRKFFSVPLLLVGSDFQKQVWNNLLTIPYGTTHSYLELSDDLGNPKAIRAVAAANGANAISIIVPCHRIIGSNGKLVGYAGGLEVKQKLLNLEKQNFGNNKQMQFDF